MKNNLAAKESMLAHCCPKQVFDGVRMEPSYN
jgi:hypothetical protein